MESQRVPSLEEGDVGVAGAVIARAFDTDELNRRQYPDAGTRARCAPMLFEALVRYDQLFGQVDHLDGFVGVASWVPPGDDETLEKLAGIASGGRQAAPLAEGPGDPGQRDQGDQRPDDDA